ncbi:MAG: penicillin-binding protein 2 [Pseudotabrizicola sp.]|uniref:penicillin-binding protein 2 n=1 Tax=Pseudotabrizicola sp. TaxID=2939647 RepID=UPI002722A933|nr:penicillin-binding protein 2 [Pseudotabrizicola sp.]MDO9641175.1 penicillin-binding protein 2 [Pseudotabrizicola sp.]
MRRSERDLAQMSQKTTRRALLMGGVMTTVLGVLGLRMWQLGVRDADQYYLLAEENRISLRLVPPNRGRIYDRAGKLVADNEQAFRITLVREEVEDLEDVLAKLRRLLGLDDEAIMKLKSQIERASGFAPITVKDRVIWEELAIVAVNAPALPGVYPETVLSRVYPFGADFAHQVGYVGPVSENDLKEEGDAAEPLLRLPDFEVGKIGIERRHERALRGLPGTRRVEVNVSGRTMRELALDPPSAGPDMQITLDHHLQNFMRVRLEGQSAAAIVMDVTNGDVLGCTSAPSFDPNLFVRGISNRDYGALRDNEFRPLSDKTVQGAYPPGSTVKMSNALAALESGVMEPAETVTCNGYVEISGRRFHCWKRGGHGRVDMVGALRESCDVYFYEVAQRIGIDGIFAMNDRLGLGQKYDLPLSGIAHGNNPSREWKQKKYGQDWLIGDTINASIGQGFTLASPIQLATMAARLASGTAVLPRMVRSISGRSTENPAPVSLGLSDEALSIVRQGMFEVSNHERGTAYASRIVDPTKVMAGKTGSSQVFSISAAERAAGVRTQAELPWNRRDHALFVAFAPFDAPRYAVTVVVEHGGGGSTAAAPIARDIMLFAQHGGLPPTDAYPASQRTRLSEQLALLSDRILPPDGATSIVSRT